MKVLFIFLYIFLASIIYPCSIFTYKIGSSVFFCGNEDWIATDPAILTIKQSKNNYGVLLFGWNSYLPNYPQAGINSEGLCFDWATVPSQNYSFIKGKDNLGINDTISILKKCKSIDDVVTYIRKYNYSHIAEEHIIFTDKSGASCVIEYTNGTFRFIQSKKTQYITNFNLTDRKSGWYPCQRYDLLESTLSNTNLQFHDLEKILDSVHQEGEDPTIYSYIFDLTTMKLYYYYNHDYSKKNTFSIIDLLKSDQLLLIK